MLSGVKQGFLSSFFVALFLSMMVIVLLGLTGCDAQRISELEEGIATEADVRQRFGEPATIYDEPGGARTFEYPRQPEGQRNYMITIGVDGMMSALRQVLKAENFALIVPEMGQDEVKRILGRPAKKQFFERFQQEVWDWRFLDGTQSKIFSVTYNTQGRVVKTDMTDDMKVVSPN
jgi:hypothetical protein